MPTHSKVYMRAWREANREKLREASRLRMRRVRAADPEKYRARSRQDNNRRYARRKLADPVALRAERRKHALKTRYRMAEADWQSLFEKQRGACAICRRCVKLHVDHCHETGRIRGLLCSKCNTALGTFGDNSAGILRVFRYLSEVAS